VVVKSFVIIIGEILSYPSRWLRYTWIRLNPND